MICENTEGVRVLRIISNVEYKATIISGSEWLTFASADNDGDGNSMTRDGVAGDMYFNHLQNNNGKRVARLVLAADTRRDTIKIKQKGRFEDYLEVHPNDLGKFTLENGTRMELPWEGGEVSFRLNTSCNDYQLSAWTAETKSLNDFKFENSVCSFRVSANDEQQPRILTFQISYVDGWDDKHILELSIKQKYNEALNKH